MRAMQEPGDNRQGAAAAGRRRVGPDRPAVDAVGQLLLLHRHRPARDAGPDDRGPAHHPGLGRPAFSSCCRWATACRPRLRNGACSFSLPPSTRVLPFLLIVWGQARATGGMAAILNASAPLFGIFLAHMLTQDEKLSWNKLAGILVGIVGVGILVGYDFAVARVPTCWPGWRCWPRRCFTCAPTFLPATKLGHYPPFVVAMMQMVGAIFVAFPLALAIDQPWTLPLPSLKALGAIVGMGAVRLRPGLAVPLHCAAAGRRHQRPARHADHAADADRARRHLPGRPADAARHGRRPDHRRRAGHHRRPLFRRGKGQS